MSTISVYKHPVTNTTPYKNVSISDIHTVVTSSKYKSVTEKLRSLPEKSDKDLVKKMELDYATFSGTFKTRSDKMLIQHSNYFCVDLDHVGGISEIQNIKTKLINSHVPALIFTSPSGDGLKVVYKIDVTQGTHKEYYFAFEDYFKTDFGIQIDEACKDVSRACFLCYDPDCFATDKAETLTRSFIYSHKTEIEEVIKTEYETGERPGDIYNQNPNSINEMKSLLESAGWKNKENYKWVRPDKSEGISATLGKVAPNVFYVFTSSAPPFEALKAYTPFQVLGLIKFNGDFKEAAKSVSTDKPKQVAHAEQQTITVSEIEKILLGARIDTSRQIDKPPTILSIKDQSGTSSVMKRLFTLGNFSCVIGKAKSRKTFVMSMLTAALLDSNITGKFVPDMPANKKEVLYFDTEQGEYDCYNVIKRIERMSGNKVNLKGYSLRQYTPSERCQIIEHAFKMWGDNTGFCVIDGIADLATAINDEDEATRVTSMMLRLTKVHNCHISTVIHQNKNDNFATGHLGSSIMKKAEMLLSVTKSKDNKEKSEVSSEYSRGIDFEPFEISIDHEGIPVVGNAVIRPKEYVPEFNEEIPEPTYKIPAHGDDLPF